MRPGYLGPLLGGLLFAGQGALAAPSSAVFDQTCAICHQAGGVGAPGEFPRLAGRAAAMARLPAGRRLMIAAVLDGSVGRVQADHQTITGVMPAFNQLTDDQVCEALNYIASLDGGSAPSFTPAEVAAVRAHPMSPNEVNALARDPVIEAAAP